MIYIRKLFTQDLRDGKQIAFPKEPSYDFFKFDYQNKEAKRYIEFTFESKDNKYQQFHGTKIKTRLYSAGSESRIDGELKAFIRDKLKIQIDDFLIIRTDSRNSNKFLFSIIPQTSPDYSLYLKITDSANHSLFEIEKDTASTNIISQPHNRIIFGAPGTGKSFQLNEDSKVFGTNFERVTFHPNYSYAQFVGTYKPTMSEPNKKPLSDEQQHILSILQDANMTSQEKYDLLYENFKDGDLTRLPILLGLFTDDNFKTKKADGTPAVGDNSVERNHGKAIRPYVNLPVQGSSDEKQIAYQYVPGPFMRIYAAAKQNPNNNYLLLIEEINRANVAAVFGDVFQLLDRKSNGESEYPVAASEDIKKYLEKKGIYEDELSIPSNMYIWATMNSADQGVFPMDTAFKRRWEFEYIGIDDNEEQVASFEIPISETKKVNWNELRKAINNQLITLGVNEDKLLGPFFLNKNTLENALSDIPHFIKLFKSKVLMYLFEDAAKMKVKTLFKADKYIYSEICKGFDKNGLNVFSDSSIQNIYTSDISLKDETLTEEQNEEV